MSGVEELRALIAQAKDTLPFGAAEQSQQSFEQVAATIAEATQGSANSEIVDAAGQAQRGAELAQELHQLAGMIEQSLDSYVGRL